MQHLASIRLRLAALSVFRGLRRDPVVSALEKLLDCGETSPARQTRRYAQFAGLVLEAGGNWTRYLFSRTLKDDNEYVRRLAAGKEIPTSLERTLEAELESLQLIGSLTPGDLMPAGIDFPVAGWETQDIDFVAGYRRQMNDIRRRGYGIFADSHMFVLKGEELQPILCPDPVDFDQLVGYEQEREAVTANTLALLEGRPCSNVLLYGDSGTGKSTCVKAIVNELYPKGLRLIELRKDQLEHIPSLVEKLGDNPLKFIFFIDDLSFSADNHQFSALKAILEGSVCARASNMAIYATSNRRHLVRETFGDRQGEEVHLRDTLEELGSLSERFGLTVTFLRPDKELYLSMVQKYCRQMGFSFDLSTARAAEAFALERGGRSARTAKQFVEQLSAASYQTRKE